MIDAGKAGPNTFRGIFGRLFLGVLLCALIMVGASLLPKLDSTIGDILVAVSAFFGLPLVFSRIDHRRSVAAYFLLVLPVIYAVAGFGCLVTLALTYSESDTGGSNSWPAPIIGGVIGSVLSFVALPTFAFVPNFRGRNAVVAGSAVTVSLITAMPLLLTRVILPGLGIPSFSSTGLGVEIFLWQTTFSIAVAFIVSKQERRRE